MIKKRKNTRIYVKYYYYLTFPLCLVRQINKRKRKYKYWEKDKALTIFDAINFSFGNVRKKQNIV